MRDYSRFYHKMPDGTLKQINPFSDTEVWCVEERRKGPAINGNSIEKVPFVPAENEEYCDFCEKNFLNCTPEKLRYFKNKDNEWEKLYYPDYEVISNIFPEFKTVGNLFEIVTYDYWRKNYNYEPPAYLREWRDSYLSIPDGYHHVMNVLKIKLERLGINFEDLSEKERLERINAFFFGSHDLIISRRHYKKGARYKHELASSGELGEEYHFYYTSITIENIERLIKQNPFISYISVFQNWLKPAGASFDHLHRQLVSLDEWGVQMEKEIEKLHENLNLYNEFAINFSIDEGLLIAENDYAIAVPEIGSNFPTISIYSKSKNCRPFEHTQEEIRGISDLVYAIHYVITSQTTCNEEWYYSPFDSVLPSPWRISIKIRVTNPAGFEGNTRIYINPISPLKLKEEICEALFSARERNGISKNIRIDTEVSKTYDPLQYSKNTMIGRIR
ncbi:MAG: DUF4921 family protein [Brevinematia bacterium]